MGKKKEESKKPSKTKAKRAPVRRSKPSRPRKASASRPAAAPTKKTRVRTPGKARARRNLARVSAAERLQQKASRREQRRAYRAVTIPAAGTATEETQARLAALSDKLKALQRAALLVDVHDDLEDLDAALAILPADIEALRARGYVFRSFLERKVQVLADQWGETRERVTGDVELRSRKLEREVVLAESAVRAAQVGRAAQVAKAERAVETLEGKVSAAQDAIEAMFDTLDENATQTQAQVEEVEWALDQADQASFAFYPAEDLVGACRAQFLETKKDGPEGVLFLTDERLIFERKEDVATKKVLFIATEKEKVQELVLDVPIGQLEEVRASQAGFLGHKEMLEIAFSREAPLSEARLRLRGADNEEWSGLIGRVRSGDIANERTRPKEEKVVEEARKAPTKCPTCGALITASVVKGMREISCEYCGAVIRL